MKKIRNVFWVELKKTVGKGSFFALILAVAFLCLCIPVSRDDGTMTNCLSVLFQVSGEEYVMSDSLKLPSLMRSVISGYFIMFAPMIVSLSILPILCEEKESGMVRYILPRSGKKASVTGSFLAAVWSGGLVVVAGYLLVFIILAIHAYFMGGLSCVSMNTQEMQQMVIRIVGVWIYGMICAVWTYLISIFLRNRYLLSCIPYIFLYLSDRMFNSISYEALADNLPMRLFVQTFGTQYLFIDFHYMFGIVAAYAVIAVLIILLHMFVLQRRVDCGQ